MAGARRPCWPGWWGCRRCWPCRRRPRPNRGALRREKQARAALAANAKTEVQARTSWRVEAIKTFHTGVSEDFLLKEEKFKELRDRLLKSASDFYGKLGALLGKETDLASRRALAQSNFELAELTRPGSQPFRPRHGVALHGQAGGRGGRIPQGVGNLSKAGRRQSRRHRIPQRTDNDPHCAGQPAAADGQAKGGGGRIPQGAGDPSKTGGCRTRRHRSQSPPGRKPPKSRRASATHGQACGVGSRVSQALAIHQNWSTTAPPPPSIAGRWHTQHDFGLLLAREERFSERYPFWTPVWPFVRSWSMPIPRTPSTQPILAQATPTKAGPESLPVSPPWPPPTCGGPPSSSGPNCRHLDPGTRFQRAGSARLAKPGQEPKSGVTPAEATTFAAEAVAALRDAINAGWMHREELKDIEFDSLRGREDFKKLVAELEAKLKPKTNSGS